MPTIRLDDPSPQETHTRTPLPVRRYGSRVGWAVYRNRLYEVDVDEDIKSGFDDGTYKLRFEMDHLRPIAVLLLEASFQDPIKHDPNDKKGSTIATFFACSSLFPVHH